MRRFESGRGDEGIRDDPGCRGEASDCCDKSQTSICESSPGRVQ